MCGISTHSSDFTCCDLFVSRTKHFHARNIFRQCGARRGPNHSVPIRVPKKGYKEDFEERKKWSALQSTGTAVIFHYHTSTNIDWFLFATPDKLTLHCTAQKTARYTYKENNVRVSWVELPIVLFRVRDCFKVLKQKKTHYDCKTHTYLFLGIHCTAQIVFIFYMYKEG